MFLECQDLGFLSKVRGHAQFNPLPAFYFGMKATGQRNSDERGEINIQGKRNGLDRND
jgi:hypothetical protein